MKMLPQFFCLLSLLTFAAGPSLRAQYNPPPPPDQTAPPADQDQGAPPSDQQAPMTQDQGAPPPDDQQAPPPDDQAAPPPDDGAGAPDAGGDASGDANFQTFYNDLSSQGTWVQTDNYGYAWQPNVQDPNWAPYQNGHWVYTGEGWAWVADNSEPWGWATYHYGRWVNIDGEGWAWVPGYTWAPAWVSWRYGGGYCGWAPLPPDTFVGIDFGGVGFGFHIGGDCDTAYGIGPGYYHFLPVGYLGARDYHGYYRNRNDNFALIGNTRNVTNIVVTNRRGSGQFGRVNAGGPNFATVNAQSRTPVQRVQLARSSRVGGGRLSGNQLAVYAPRVSAAGAGANYRPRSVGRTLNNVQVNRGTNIAQPLAVNSRLRPAAASAQQIEAAHTAEGHASRNAGIATAGTQPTNAMTRSLSTYQPHNTARSQTSQGSHTSAATVKPHTKTSTGGSADRAFTGHATTENRMTEAQARQEASRTAQRSQASTQATASHTQANANTEAERAQREQTSREQSEHEQAQREQSNREQTEHAQAQREQTQHSEVEHTPAQHAQEQRAPVQHEVQHAAPQHAAPQQHAAPAQHDDGGGSGKDDHH
jgi:hypothetical protein